MVRLLKVIPYGKSTRFRYVASFGLATRVQLYAVSFLKLFSFFACVLICTINIYVLFSIQGWAPDFIVLNLQKGLDLGLMDSTILIPDGVSVRTSKQLARNEGILTGISGGATG